MSDSMAGPAALPDAATVLAFWREAGPARWYAKDEQFDRTFTMRFEAAHMAAARGGIDGLVRQRRGGAGIADSAGSIPA